MATLRPDPSTPPSNAPIGRLPAEGNDTLDLGAYGEDTEELALGDADDSEELALGGSEDEELALGASDDDSDELELGAAVLSISFGAQATQTTQISLTDEHDLSTAWMDDIGDVAELSVQETQGEFAADQQFDVFIMEEEFDPDAEVLTAVWEFPDGQHIFGTRVRRTSTARQLLPYAILGSALGVAGIVAFLCIVVIVLLGFLLGPSREVVPLDPADMPKVEIERKPIEDKTADEILDEVLGDE